LYGYYYYNSNSITNMFLCKGYDDSWRGSVGNGIVMRLIAGTE